MKFNMDYIRSSLNRMTNAGLQTLKYHAPAILTVGGVLGIVGAGVLACKASLKLNETMSACTANIQSVRDESIPADDIEAKKAHNISLAKAYISTGTEMCKMYAFPVTLGIVSISAILMGKKILSDRYSRAVSALSVSEQIFAKYRERVRNELGDEQDHNFRYGIHEQVRTEPVMDKNGEPKLDKNGEPKTKTIAEKIIEPINENEYARMFSETSTPEWSNDYEYNIQKILMAQTFFTQRLRSRGWLSLNEVYEYFGFPVTAAGQDMGWVVDEQESMPVIDFGIQKVNESNGLRRIDCMDNDYNAVLLTFDGLRYIKDKIYKCQKVF